MLASLRLLVLGAIVTARTGFSINHADATSWESFVNMIPECAQPCFDQLFDKYLAEGCGQVQTSIDPKDITCLCSTGTDEDGMKADMELRIYVTEKCGDSVDADDLAGPGVELVEWCAKVGVPI